MLNEQLRKKLEQSANRKMEALKQKSPDCRFSVIVYDSNSGTREGEIVIEKIKPDDEIVETVVGNCRQN
ncbi:MAG: hypothetical protein WA152_04130 [Microgenomates group bacterium]